ncbi:N-acetylmuramoyl-L-alanine amidase [bacterium]|nr:MAG: N-acetylmuramoyl-L-alanine amidase [bacterium]
MKQLSKIAVTTLSLSLAVAHCALAQTPSQASKATTSAKFSVVIDAGHGGTDKGEDEKEINLSLALQLRTELEKQGMRVILTRSKDEFLPLRERVDVANQVKADCFISLHGQHQKQRPFSYTLNYKNSNSVLLAQTLDNGLTKRLNPTIKGQVAPANYFVIRETTVPSVMVMRNLDTPSTPKSEHQLVIALAEGIENYAQTQKSTNKEAPILRDIPNLGKFFNSPSKPQQAPKSTPPTSPLLRKPPGNLNFLSTKTGK